MHNLFSDFNFLSVITNSRWQNILVFINYLLGLIIIIYGIINLIIPLRIRIISIPLSSLFIFSTLINIIIIGWPNSGAYNYIQTGLVPDTLNFLFHFK